MRALLLIHIFIAFTAIACGMAKRIYKRPERAVLEKMYLPCEKQYKISKKKNFVVNSPVGKFCNKTCKNYKDKKKCNEYKILVKDYSNKEVFESFRSGKYIFIPKSVLFQ